MAILLGKYTFTVSSVGATTTLSLSVALDDSAGDYPGGPDFSNQENVPLPANVIQSIEAAIATAAVNGAKTAINMDLNLDNFPRWDNQIDRIFLNARNGYGPSEEWELTRDITEDNVREWRMSRS